MADEVRILISEINGGLKHTELLDGGSNLIHSAKIDPTNIVTEDSALASDHVIVNRAGAVRKVLVSNFAPTYIIPFFVHFPGSITEATSDAYYERKIYGVNGKTCKIVGLSVVGSRRSAGASGNVVFAAGNASYSGSGGEITVTLAYNAVTTTPAVGSVTLAGTPPVGYVRVKSLSGDARPTDIWLQVDMEVGA